MSRASRRDARAARGAIDPTVFHRRSNRWLGEVAAFANPVLRAAARVRAGRAPAPPTAWRRGLIVGHSHIGDLLYRSCSLHRLSELLPACRWSYLCAPGASEVLVGNPALTELLPMMRGDDPWTLERGAFAELRAREFDVVLCTDTIRYYTDQALAAALGVPARVGFVHKGLAGLVTDAVPIEVPSPFPAYFRAMVAHVGGVAPDWPLRPRVYASARNVDRAHAARAELPIGEGRRVVACAITTRQPGGNWPREHLLAALRIASAAEPFELVLCGAAGDAPTLSAVADALPFPAHVLAGTLDLRAFAAFLGGCDALVTLDTGSRHLGNAAGIPVLFARNLSHLRVEAGAYAPAEVELTPPVERLSDAEIAALARRLPPDDLAAPIVRALRAGPRRAGRERH